MFMVHWLIAATIVVLCTAAPSTDADVAWQNFKLAHGKEYRNLHEEAVRKAAFLENFNKITAHNKLYEEGQVSYSLKVNKYADLTHEEHKKTFNGYKKSAVSLSEIDIIHFVPDDSVEIPDEFDWRTKGAVTPVKDQGYCGSCWTFSSTGALEGQYFLKTGKLPSISEQNLVDCSFESGNAGCDGGDMNPAFTYVHNNDGIDSEEAYPYEAEDGKCRYDLSGNVTSSRGFATIENGNEDYLKAAVATIGPIAVAIDASQDDFGLYSEGIYYNPDCNDGSVDPDNDLDHAVLAVGYGTLDGQDYWLIKNSWGTDWGDNGYIKMARNRANNCGVAAAASFPLNY